jgi:hypothetical protein
MSNTIGNNSAFPGGCVPDSPPTQEPEAPDASFPPPDNEPPDVWPAPDGGGMPCIPEPEPFPDPIGPCGPDPFPPPWDPPPYDPGPLTPPYEGE